MKRLSLLRKTKTSPPAGQSHAANGQRVLVAPNEADYERIFGEMRWNGDRAQLLSTSLSHLPPEVLAQCFLWYIRAIYETRAGQQISSIPYLFDPPPQPYAWLVIRHVSREWRSVALTFPELSSYICITTPECVWDMLCRSSSAPLHVYEADGFDTGPRKAARRLVLEHVGRMISADLKCAGQVLDPAARSNEPLTGGQKVRTIMRSLQIDASIPPSGQQAAFTRYDFPCLAEFVCKCGSTSPFRRVLGRSLRRLHLYQCVHWSFPEQLVALLSQVPQLEELVLDNAFRTHPLPSDTIPATPAPTGAVTLARLRVLTIWDDDFTAVSVVLDRLIHSAKIYASFQIFHILPDTSSQMAQLFVPRCGTSNSTDVVSPYPNSVSIVRRSATELELHYWEERKGVAELCEERASGCAAACYAFTCLNANSRFIDELLWLIPLHDVKSALLVEPTVSGSLVWGAILRSLISVEELGLEYETFRNGDARTPSNGLVDEVARSVLLPSVSRVYAWEHDHAHSALPPSEHHPLSSLQHTMHALSSRDASAPSAPAERVSVSREVLDYHEDSGKVCLCEDIVYLDVFPPVSRRAMERAAEPDAAPPHDEGRSWLGSQVKSLRHALRRRTRK